MAIQLTDEQKKQAREMDLLFNNPNKQTYGEATDALTKEKEKVVYSSLAERRSAEKLKSIQDQKRNLTDSKPAGPLSLYELRKRDWVADPKNLTLEDEINIWNR